jgi:hypothetical protein
MTRRKKFGLLAVVALAIAAVGLFWPRDNREARKMLDELRGLIEVEAEAGQIDLDEIDHTLTAQIVVDTQCVELCLTDATAGLFAMPGQASSPVWGRMQSIEQANQLMKNFYKPGVFGRPVATLPVLTLPQPMRVLAQPGVGNEICSGYRIPVKASNPLGVDMHHVGHVVEFVPRMTKQGDIALEVQVTLSRLPAGEESVPLNQVLESAPQIDRVSTGKIVARLRSGEVFVIGGLVKPGKSPKTIKAPLLSDLPWVGSWLSWTYTRAIEEELIVFVAPRIVSDQVKQR